MDYWIIIALVFTLFIVPVLWLKICKKFGIIEHKKRADYYKRMPVPNAQGVALRITLLICIALLWWKFIDNIYTLIYIGAWSILALLATIDLFKPIPSWVRLVLQLWLFTSIVVFGGISIDTVRIIGNDIPIQSRIGILGSIVWFVMCTNAVNRFDGIQWQSSGVTSVWAFALWAVVSFIVIPSYEHLTPNILNQLQITQIIALSLGLVSLVYTYIEYKPLGLIRDIWTTIYGFSLAYLALLWGAKVWILVVTLSLVMFDAVWVTINRIFILKKNPFKWDYTHLHHRLIANGRSRSEIRWFVWIRSFVMTILMILQWTSSINKRIILIMMALLFFGVNIYLFWIKKLPSEMKVDFNTDEVEDLKMDI
jgi:UDP-N-acetylmuramyl pentapeptide phosphotransferase/UDP-N-acetylglucosamine-1-phosphate transferase